MKIKNIFLLIIIASLWGGCKKDFLSHPSTTSPTSDNYYNTPDQVNGSTGLLYNAVWGDWFDKAFISVGDVLGGTVTGVAGNDQYNSFYNFNIQSTDGLISNTWNSCYKVAGSASVLIQTFQAKKGQVSDPSYLDLGIAEARFIRGFAYFYIARAFGDAPIIDNPLALTEPGKNLVPRYFQKDVLRFALEDLMFAETNLPALPYQKGRVTKYSAKAMMAKLYLYSKDYENAKTKAKEVIDYAEAHPDQVGLYANYGEMFTSSSANNNKESLFALQWAASLGWNGGNRYAIYAAPQPLMKPQPTGGDGYSAIIPSLDMLDPVTGYEEGDKRRSWSVMEQGFHRDDWKNDNFPNGFTYDTTTSVTTDFKVKTGTRSNILKYVVGPNRSSEPVIAPGFSNMCTYILRYADVLLIYAEATLGAGNSTSDPGALLYFNQVRRRAGFPASADKITITKDDILHERKVEFAFEGDYWFDIQRQGFAKANQMLAQQERGTYDSNRNVSSLKVRLNSESQLFLPAPQSETVINPLLLEPAVAYYQ